MKSGWGIAPSTLARARGLPRRARGQSRPGMDAAEQRVRLRFSPLGYLVVIGAGVLLLTMVGLLIAQLAILSDSREHIQAQDHKMATLQGEGKKAARDARPALEQVEPLLRRARGLLTPAG